MPLQMMENDGYDDGDELLTSHKLANELRELYDLPANETEKVLVHTITNLGGLLKEYVDSVESMVDVIKDGRENIS
jgi:hypothetical protein